MLSKYLKMLTGLGLVLSLLAPMTVRAQSADLAGIHYPDSLQVEGSALVLNGSGISYRAVAKIYTVALYVAKKANTADAILSMNGPKQLRFVMLQGMRIDEIGKLITTGVENNSTRTQFYGLIPAIHSMGEQFSHIKRMAPGDVFAIEWVPKRGTIFFVNNQPAGLPIQEPDFFNAILRTWLGKNPPSQGLKDALLDYRAPSVLNALD
jgi:chalcone isomerase-like protein